MSIFVPLFVVEIFNDHSPTCTSKMGELKLVKANTVMYLYC